MKDFIEKLYSERLEEREGFLKSIIDDKKELNFYKEIHLKEETFFKHFREGKLSLNTIKRTGEMLEMTPEEISFVFFGQTKHEKKVYTITTMIQGHLEELPSEEREDYLEELRRRIEILEECL